MDNINNQEQETEEKVLDAARVVFRQKGYSGARMEDIARLAGVNKALLNYYYRSKEKMFQTVFQQDFEQFMPSVMQILDSDLPLDVKIYRTVNTYSQMLLANPDLPLFILSEIRENPDKLAHIIAGEPGRDPFRNLAEQLESEHQKGTIIQISPPQFVLNLLSLTVFPFVARPVLHRIFRIDNNTFDSLAKERLKMVPRMIIDSLTPVR